MLAAREILYAAMTQDRRLVDVASSIAKRRVTSLNIAAANRLGAFIPDSVRAISDMS